MQSDCWTLSVAVSLQSALVSMDVGVISNLPLRILTLILQFDADWLCFN